MTDHLKRSDNPFGLLGLSKGDAEELSIKQEAILLLRRKLLESGMSQTDLAAQAGLDDTDVSAMLRGRLARFSIDRINRALSVFDCAIETSYSIRGVA